MKFRIIASIVILAIVGALAFLADVSQSDKPGAQQPSSSSSGSSRTGGRVSNLN